VHAYFSYRFDEGVLRWRSTDGEADSDRRLEALRGALQADLPRTAADKYDTRWNQLVLVDVTAWGPRAIVLRFYPEPGPAPESMYGFVVPEEVLTERLTEILDREPILPGARLGSADQEDLLAVEIRDGAGRRMAASPNYAHSAFTAWESLGDAFGALTVTVAMPDDAAETLVIGGLPASRLPAILALLLLTTGVVIAAIRLLRREAELGALRADFVSSISHELRTPIAQIRMFGETLLLDRVRSDEERQRSLEILVKESRRLAHQVDNVLLFSRAEQQTVRLDPKPTDLRALLQEIVEGFRPLAETRGMRLRNDFDSDVVASVDAMALEQTVINLLDNAVKYGPDGQTIRLGVRSTRAGHAQIVVEDEGPGIPPEDRDTIWDPYARLERDRESAIAGTGIGLAVVREMVRRMDGTVRVENGTGGGARFVIEFVRGEEGEGP
jgi:signal transduction histidine kinase